MWRIDVVAPGRVLILQCAADRTGIFVHSEVAEMRCFDTLTTLLEERSFQQLRMLVYAKTACEVLERIRKKKERSPSLPALKSQPQKGEDVNLDRIDAPFQLFIPHRQQANKKYFS